MYFRMKVIIFKYIIKKNIFSISKPDWRRFRDFQPYIPEFQLKGVTLHVVATYKYLGNYISDDLPDDDDINRQRRTLYVQGNMILRKCSMCSLEVKLTLFRSYCSPMYGLQLWWNYKKFTLNRLHIAYHNIV